ncbi:MAG: heme o synthase [Syntrophobacteraceae bacterium]
MIRDYIDSAKPGILAGNLVSTAGGFFLASRGRIDTEALWATLAGVCLAVASACVFNNCIDRKLDGKMKRTRNRALARGALSVRAACLYATLLAIPGAALLGAAVNLLAAAIVSAGFIIYVGIYSLHLKRTSIYATLVGSLAGAAPPLAGYCAVTNRFDSAAALLLVIFIVWQLPHYYSIAIFRLDDYAAAQIPILPVRRGTAVAKRHIVVHILAFTAAALMLTVCGYTGYGYFAVTAASGLAWLFFAWSGRTAPDERLWAKRLYVCSLLAMLVLSFMMSVDYRPIL